MWLTEKRQLRRLRDYGSDCSPAGKSGVDENLDNRDGLFELVSQTPNPYSCSALPLCTSCSCEQKEGVWLHRDAHVNEDEGVVVFGQKAR